jgi:hypothetical protein
LASSTVISSESETAHRLNSLLSKQTLMPSCSPPTFAWVRFHQIVGAEVYNSSPA